MQRILQWKIRFPDYLKAYLHFQIFLFVCFFSPGRHENIFHSLQHTRLVKVSAQKQERFLN